MSAQRSDAARRKSCWRQNVISLIDPTTGKEITRQTLVGAAVAGLAYDGAEDTKV